MLCFADTPHQLSIVQKKRGQLLSGAPNTFVIWPRLTSLVPHTILSSFLHKPPSWLYQTSSIPCLPEWVLPFLSINRKAESLLFSEDFSNLPLAWAQMSHLHHGSVSLFHSCCDFSSYCFFPMTLPFTDVNPPRVGSEYYSSIYF